MYFYIVNPAAGGGSVSSIQDKLKLKLHKLHIDGEFSKTTGPGEAYRIALAAIAEGHKTIVAIGGDDTVNEIMEAAYQGNVKHIAIGIIPTGSQNLVARRLGIINWEQACVVLSARRVYRYRLSEINGKVFMNCSTFSIEDADHSSKFALYKSRAKKKNPNLMLYQIKTIDDLHILGKTTNITVCNQKFIDSNLENLLLIKVSEDEDSGMPFSILKRMHGKANGYPAHTQLITTSFVLAFKKPVVAKFDGSQIIDDNFLIKLSSKEVNMIVERSRHETL